MKIRSVNVNNHKKAFDIDAEGRRLFYPYALATPAPSSTDSICSVGVDVELAREAFTFRLASGAEGTVHADQVLEYNEDPTYLRDLLLYRLTLEARSRIESSPLSKREVVRRLDTSAAQLYRLLDQTNTSKTIDSMVSLLSVLGCEVDLVVHDRSA